MNESDDHYEDVPATALTNNKADGLSPGEILREARLSHDYSVADLCAQTKLSEKTVNALEDNDFAALSQPVFARGYYRQCAKVLDIDTDRLMAAYTAWAGEAAPRPAPPTAVDVVPQDVTPHRWRALGLVSVVLVLLVAIGAVFLILPDAPLPDENAGGDNTVVLQDETRDTGAEPSGASAGNDAGAGGTPDVAATAGAADAGQNGNNAGGAAGTENGSQSQRPVGGRNVNETLGIQNGPADENASEAAEPAVAANHLVLEFTGRSWVDVRAADGSRLLTGIYESGETREFDAATPYRITLGYAPGVNVTIGGQPVDVAAETTGNSTARLTVNARGGQ